MYPVLKKLGFSRDDRVVIIHTEDIGIATTVYSLWNAFIDPLFGYITDNTRSKRGRRIPYMRFTAPFLALTFILVWFAPPQAEQQTLFWWMLISMLLYDTC